MKEVTIKDVANHANVGVGTVSRVINNEKEVSAKTRKKVLESIKALNYVPNYTARSMRTNLYKNIAFFADISNPIFAKIAKEAQIELEKKGYLLSLSDISEKNIENKIASFLYGRKFDGLILSLPTENNKSINQFLIELNIPIVTINRDIPNLPSGIVTDYYTSVKEAITYLLKSGHVNISLIGGNRYIRPTKEGIKGYKDAYTLFNLDVNNNLIKHGNFTRAMEKIFDEIIPQIQQRNVTACLCLNNEMFYGILQSMKENKIRYRRIFL